MRGTIWRTGVAWIGKHYDDERVTIDQKTKNPGRVAPIPGTVKCKGSHIANRPYRLATLDSPDREPCENPRFDLRAWITSVGADRVEDNPAAQTAGHAGGYKPLSWDADDRARIIERARRCIMSPRFEESIAGQDGHGASITRPAS